MRAITLISLLTVLLSCGPELEDCDSKADVMWGVWIIKEVFIDGQRQEPTSYKAYRLDLRKEGDYERTQPSGIPDTGGWSISSGETELILDPNNSPEENYVLESFTLREMVLVLNRNSSKEGPSQIRFILIPEL